MEKPRTSSTIERFREARRSAAGIYHLRVSVASLMMIRIGANHFQIDMNASDSKSATKAEVQKSTRATLNEGK